MDSFVDLAKYGAVGIILALIVAVLYIVKLFTDTIKSHDETTKNHMQHNTDALTGLQVAITELVTWLKAKNSQR